MLEIKVTRAGEDTTIGKVHELILAAEKTRNPRLVQKWLGHTTLETTMIYMDLVGAEEQKTARAMWTQAA